MPNFAGVAVKLPAQAGIKVCPTQIVGRLWETNYRSQLSKDAVALLAMYEEEEMYE